MFLFKNKLDNSVQVSIQLLIHHVISLQSLLAILIYWKSPLYIASRSHLLEVTVIYCKQFYFIGSCFNLLQVAHFIGSRFQILQVTSIYWKSFLYIASYINLLQVAFIYWKSSHLLEPPYIASCHLLQVVLQTSPIH